MEDTSPCVFWPQDIGPYMTELSLLYSELECVPDIAEASIIVRDHLLNLPKYINADLSNLRYRAYLLVLIDLLRQDWQLICRQGRFYLKPPSWIESAKGSEAVQKQKAAIRASLNYERIAQLNKPSVQAFVRKMERPRLFKGQPISIFSLYANGEELANDLKTVRDYTDETKQSEIICEIIQPYLQQVTSDTRCEHTGLLLNDIWRYIRYTWSIPYNSTPGRNVFYLIRDGARPFHPVIGIAALGSSLVQLTARDSVIGWTLQSTLDRIKNSEFTLTDAQKIVYMWKSTLNVSLADVASDDLNINSDDLFNPTPEVLSHLRTVSKEARLKRIELLQKYRGLARQKSSDVTASFSGLTEDKEDIQYIEQQANYNLFKAKRAESLFWLLSAKSSLDDCPFELETVEGLRAFIEDQTGKQTLQTLIRENKKRKVGINMMDIIVCGAIPPYNFVLGGKLVAMMMTSPQVIYDYRQKYKDAVSDIASKMKQDVVYKDPKLVFLGTTSLYHSGSSQYNRISVPLLNSNYQLKYENYGKTLGFGSVHYSKETIEALKELQEHADDAQLINNRFGEGVNPKLRRIRAGLASIGLESSDSFLNHRSKRIIYGIPLGKLAYEFLRGEVDDPEYFFDLSSVEIVKKGTEYISQFWAKRWLRMRINNQEVIDNVTSFNKADVALSPNFDSSTKLIVQQYALFGGTTI